MLSKRSLLLSGLGLGLGWGALRLTSETKPERGSVLNPGEKWDVLSGFGTTDFVAVSLIRDQTSRGDLFVWDTAGNLVLKIVSRAKNGIVVNPFLSESGELIFNEVTGYKPNFIERIYSTSLHDPSPKATLLHESKRYLSLVRRLQSSDGSAEGKLLCMIGDLNFNNLNHPLSSQSLAYLQDGKEVELEGVKFRSATALCPTGADSFFVVSSQAEFPQSPSRKPLGNWRYQQVFSVDIRESSVRVKESLLKAPPDMEVYYVQQDACAKSFFAALFSATSTPQGFGYFTLAEFDVATGAVVSTWKLPTGFTMSLPIVFGRPGNPDRVGFLVTPNQRSTEPWGKLDLLILELESNQISRVPLRVEEPKHLVIV